MFKPMLAGKANLSKLPFPLLASPKIDGVRGTILSEGLRSRSLMPFVNRHTQQMYSIKALAGLDGEFTLGTPTAHDVFLRTSEVMRRIEGAPALTFWAFDDWKCAGLFETRYNFVRERILADRHIHPSLDIRFLEHHLVRNMDELEALEEQWTGEGFEGLMVRRLDGPYKFGRSTATEGYLLKIKRFEDGEAVVLGVIEEMHNTNEATVSELGRTKRSSHKANKVGKGTMGALRVRGLNGRFKGVEFNVGSGFTADDRAAVWRPGDIIRYSYFAVGVKDKPRHPVYQGRRMPEDMS